MGWEGGSGMGHFVELLLLLGALCQHLVEPALGVVERVSLPARSEAQPFAGLAGVDVVGFHGTCRRRVHV